MIRIRMHLVLRWMVGDGSICILQIGVVCGRCCGLFCQEMLVFSSCVLLFGRDVQGMGRRSQVLQPSGEQKSKMWQHEMGDDRLIVKL